MSNQNETMDRFPRGAIGALVAVLLLGAGWSGGASASALGQTAPNTVQYVLGTDYSVMTYSGVGDVTASVQAVDLMFGLGNGATSGCEAADFAGFVAGSIALLQRGLCSFELKAENAAAAGAVGALIFNQGNTVDRLGLLNGTLNDTYTGNIPVMGLTYDLGALFAGTAGLTLRMFVTREDAAPSVPEPGTLALLGLGLAGLGLSRRRKMN